jgi:lysozyme
MKPSTNAYNLVKASEGLKLVAYPDPGSGGDPWTIGYGSTHGVTKGMTISPDEAYARLIGDMAGASVYVNAYVKSPLNQNQYDALCDFVFNVGPGREGVKDGFVTLKSGEPSTILRKLNAGDYAGAAAEFPKWAKASGKVMPGLVKRRAAERELFERPA